MTDADHEPFSNPLAPPSQGYSRQQSSGGGHSSDQSQPLTNDDFRKLLMTPRVPSSGGAGPAASVRSHDRDRPKTILKEELNENKKKKKKFYASIKKHEEDMLAELALKYRDRARERRDGDNPDYQHEDPMSISRSHYRAVAPDAKSGMDAAERRKQMIQESKFLGGDMEHTHLVKGLDYALLQKVRAEIHTKDKEPRENEMDDDDDDDQEEDEEEKAAAASAKKKTSKGAKDLPDVPDIPDEPDDPNTVRSPMAQNIMKVLFRTQLPQRNELFLPGRMAYIVDLETEYADSDIPTTVIRSKADCPNLESATTMSTNDIVINKLTQILSYLRQGGGTARRLKKGKEKIPLIGKSEAAKYDEKSEKQSSTVEDSIYGDIGDYVPTTTRKETRDRDKNRDRGRDRDRDRDRKDRERKDRDRNRPPSYFDKPSQSEESESRSRRDERINKVPVMMKPEMEVHQVQKKPNKLENEMPESYAECYPGKKLNLALI